MGWTADALCAAALLGALGWLALTVLAPWGRAHGASWAPWVYLFFDPICHQSAERSFHLLGEPLAVCHRCFGLYLGFVLGWVVHCVWRAPSELVARRPRLVVWCALPLLLDALVLPLFWSNSPLSRVLTGVLAAMPLSALVWIGLRQLTESLFMNARDHGAAVKLG